MRASGDFESRWSAPFASFATKGEAQQAVESLRISANRESTGIAAQPETFRALVEDYRVKEMPVDVHEGKTRGTKLVYSSVLNHHIMPKWGNTLTAAHRQH